MFRSDLKFIGMPEEIEVPPKISMRFTCPDCGGHNLDIESADVLGCQRVKGIDEEGKLVLGRPTFYTDESHFYLSCPDCGREFNVDLNVFEPGKKLIEWLKTAAEGPDGEDHAGDTEHEEP